MAGYDGDYRESIKSLWSSRVAQTEQLCPSDGNPEAISSQVALVPTNARVFADTASLCRIVGFH